VAVDDATDEAGADAHGGRRSRGPHLAAGMYPEELAQRHEEKPLVAEPHHLGQEPPGPRADLAEVAQRGGDAGRLDGEPDDAGHLADPRREVRRAEPVHPALPRLRRHGHLSTSERRRQASSS
jgi:hypothetical protein